MPQIPTVSGDDGPRKSEGTALNRWKSEAGDLGAAHAVTGPMRFGWPCLCLVSFLTACFAPDGAFDEDDRRDPERDQAAAACEMPAAARPLPLDWFQVPCFETVAALAEPAVATNDAEFAALFADSGCTTPLSVIDFQNLRAVVFGDIARGEWVVEAEGSLHVAITTYGGPAPGSQGMPVVLVPLNPEPIVTVVCQGSSGCTADGLCPP
jgi:hypothetical protein